MLNEIWRHFQMGGWMMWVIFALGFVAVAAAVRFVRQGEHQLLGFLRWMLGALAVSGAMGFGTGMILVFNYAGRVAGAPELAPEAALLKSNLILLEGTGEAMNCPVASLLFSVVIVLLVAVGLRRFPKPNASALV